jgi:hypothetical protein
MEFESESSPSPDQEDSIDSQSAEDDLDEFETGFYLCRWPNGEFSLVKADDRKDAVFQLDEWAGAEPAWLVPMETFMVDFHLNGRGEIELAEFGKKPQSSFGRRATPSRVQLENSRAARLSMSRPTGSSVSR